MVLRFIFSLIISTVTVLFLTITFAIFSGRGSLCGVMIFYSLVILTFYFFLGPILLSKVRARKHSSAFSSHVTLKRTLSRWAFRLGLQAPAIYTTPLLGSNFFVIHPPLQRPSIVLGQVLIDELSPEEIEIIIETAFVAVKTGESRTRYVMTVLLVPLFLPHLLGFLLPKGMALHFVRIINFFLFPLEMFRILFMKSARSYEKLDRYLLTVGIDQSRFNSLIMSLSKRFHHPTLDRLTLTLVDNLFLFDPPEYETAMGSLLYGAEVKKRVARLTASVMDK